MREIRNYFESMSKYDYLAYDTKNGRGFIVHIDYDEQKRQVVKVSFDQI